MTITNEATTLQKQAVESGWVKTWGTRGNTVFKKGDIYTWQNGRSYPTIKLWWMVADLIDGHFTNHRKYNTLIEVFQNEGLTD